MSFLKTISNRVLFTILIIGTGSTYFCSSVSFGKVPEELSKDSKNNDEMVNAIFAIHGGEICLTKLYKSKTFKKIINANTGYSFGYTTRTVDIKKSVEAQKSTEQPMVDQVTLEQLKLEQVGVEQSNFEQLKSVELYYGDTGFFTQPCL
jgi:hypothetical protein